MSTANVKRLAHACIFTTDLEATQRFWTEALGLRVAFRFTRGGEVIGFYLDIGDRDREVDW